LLLTKLPAIKGARRAGRHAVCKFRKAIALEVLVFGKHNPNLEITTSCPGAPIKDAWAAFVVSGSE